MKRTADQGGAVKPGNRAVSHEETKAAPQNGSAVLQALVDNMQQGILFETGDRRILFANQSFCNLFGISSPDALLGADCVLMAEQTKHAFADPGGFIAAIEHRLKECKTVLSEELSLADGRIMERDYIPLAAASEQTGNYWIYRDITERRRAERALMESETRLRMVTENAPDIIVELDSRGHILFMNRVLTGFKLSDVIGQDFCNWVPQKYHALMRRTLEQVFLTGKPQDFETQGSGDHGEMRWYMSLISPVKADGRVSRAVLVARDITDQKQSEERLRAREKQLAESQRIAHIGSWEHNLTTGQVFWSDELFRLLGLDPRKDPADFRMFFNMIHPEDQPALTKAIEETVQRGKPFGIEYRFVYRDGTVRIIYARAELIHDEAGTQNILSGTAQDITERKKAEQELAVSEDRYRNLFEDSPISLWEEDITDLQAHIATLRASGITDFGMHFANHPEEVLKCVGMVKIISVNKATLDMFEAPDHAALLRGLSQVFTEQSLEAFRGIIVALTEGAKMYTCEAVNQTLRGRSINVLLRWSLLASDYTKRSRALISIVDITERKKAEEKIRQSEARYKNLFESSTDGIFILDLDGNFIDANTTAYTRLGYTKEEMLSLHISKLDHPSFAGRVPARLKEIQDHGVAVFESGHLRKDGSMMPVEVNSRMFEHKGKQVYFSVIRDITERKKAESALKESERRLRTLIDAIPDAVVFKDAAGRHIIANRANKEVIGLSPEMLIGKTVEDLLPPEEAVTCRKNDEEVMKKRETVRDEEHMTGKDGTTRIIDTIKVPLYDDSGNALGLVGIIRDITERKQTEEKMRQSEQFIRGILDTVDEGFIVVDRSYNILTANKAYCGQTGLSCDEVIGRHCFEISHKTSRPCYEEGEECAVRMVFGSGEPYAALHKHTDREGHVLFVETKGFPIKDAAGNVTSVIETINNITEKHLLEEERLKIQKLESIGTLAGGIAHDFNNLLQGVFGYISVAKMTIDQKDRALAMLDQAENALHQSVNLTTQLLTFSKGGKPLKKPLNLRPVIENAARFTLSGSRSDFRMDVAEDLWQAEADEGQIGQVIQNIVLNADQAMPLGGSVIVTASNVDGSGASLPPGLARGNYIAISIRDTGVGIPEQYAGKIFDPYFTTKEKGSGLGLATSYSIVRNHGGMIDVRTKPGEGSTFTIYLPAIAGSARTAAVAVPGPSPQRAARVLVMDDEEIIRNLSRELIGALGHEADVARHGEETLEKYREALAAGKPFDLVILDLTVRGGTGGVETIKKLREIDPAVKAVVSSGYSDDAAIASHLSLGFKASLKKPYNVDQLRRVLNSLLS